MSEEEIEILEKLKKYMQDNIDSGHHKFMYNEYEEDKCIDIINAIDSAIKTEIKIPDKKLVEKSIGQIIKNPEECWFDSIEVKVIRNNILYGVDIEKDFVTLKELSDEHPEECFTVIAESPLSGAIYRYNNNGKHEWQLIGAMHGYA